MRLFRPLQDAVDAVIRELKRIGDSLQQYIATVREAKHTHEEQQSPPEISGIRDAIKSIAETQHTAHSPKGWHKDRTFLVSLAGVLVVLAYTAVTLRTYNKIAEQTDLQRKAQRPWVGIVPESVTAKLYIPPIAEGTRNEQRLVIQGKLGNSGNSVFSNLSAVWQWHPKEFQDVQDEVCNKLNWLSSKTSKSAEPRRGGFTIFPGSQLPWRLNESNVEGPVPNEGPPFHIFVSGCTIYREPDGTPHQTRWCVMSPDINDPTSDEEIAKALKDGGITFNACQMGQYAN